MQPFGRLATETRNVRLPGRGTQLREDLSPNWQDSGRYADATEIVRQESIRDYFATNMKSENGVVVMNLNKAKGKQFDEVIVCEGWPRTARKRIMPNPDQT